MLNTSRLYMVCYIHSYLLICTSFDLFVTFFEIKKWISCCRKKGTKYKYENSNANIVEVLKFFTNKVLDEEGTAGFLSQIEGFFVSVLVIVNYSELNVKPF